MYLPPHHIPFAQSENIILFNESAEWGRLITVIIRAPAVLWHCLSAWWTFVLILFLLRQNVDRRFSSSVIEQGWFIDEDNVIRSKAPEQDDLELEFINFFKGNNGLSSSFWSDWHNIYILSFLQTFWLMLATAIKPVFISGFLVAPGLFYGC